MQRNTPIDSGGTSFDDLIVESVTITYEWLDSSITAPRRTIPVGNVVIPADGTGAVSFAPLLFSDFAPQMEGQTATLTMELLARTVSRDPVHALAEGQLIVEVCP